MATDMDIDVDWVSILGKESIAVGYHLRDFIASTLVKTLPSSTYVILTDTSIAKLYLDQLVQALRAKLEKQGKSTRVISYAVRPGEESKSRATKAEVEDYLFSQGCTRDTVLIALGGGVIGDLGGFVAATFMRGIKVVQVPTTLLGMVDSAVGGKTAIDVPHGKNLVGAFYQPEYIFVDVSLLETLPEREFVNGMAEVIKTAAIWDAKAFDDLETNVASIRSAVLEPVNVGQRTGRTVATRTEAQQLLLSVIHSSIAVKSHIVTIDEKETGLRNLVNFGHTIGHALEGILTPYILHGECVSVGMVLEAEVARSMGVLGAATVGRLSRCLKAHGLPITVSDPRIANSPNAQSMTVPKLMKIMKLDKKNAGQVKKVVLLSRIGKTHEEKASAVPDSIIASILSPVMQVLPGPPSVSEVTMSTPGSKSISNRALVLAALAKGTCKISNLLHSDDTQVMMSALQAMQGASFTWEDNGETLVVTGNGGRLSPPVGDKEIYLGNAGTAARFLTSVCTLVQSPSSASARTVITGNKRMKERPIGPLVDALTANGADLTYKESTGCLPLSIGATGLTGGHIQLAASISSQYVSSILLSAPYATKEVTLELVGGTVISQPYIDMTCAMMETFGIKVERLTDASGKTLDKYRIPQGTYTNPAAYSVESDASSATYPLAIAAINGTTCTISNIGSASLQGDARFAKEVLEPMGCKVQQSATSTTVTGPSPGNLRALPLVDMEPMTDAFLTAAALAAVAVESSNQKESNQKPTSTRIVGIANQRVKECDRIAAMRDQLAKFGVETSDIDTGIEIIGRTPDSLKSNPTIHCYDDHRVAMAFSVLASVPGGSGATITERRCVEKTWPSYWEDLSTKLGITVNGKELRHDDAITDPKRAKYDTAATIFLIGMRGNGKTYFGKIGAALLGRQLVDADVYFEERAGMGVREFVRDNGWPAFRQRELDYFKELLENKAMDHVISLGGGIVETPEAHALLKEYTQKRGPVVNIVRDLDEVVAYLDAESGRPAYGESIRDVAARRTPLFRSCSSFDFVNHTGFKALAKNLTNGAGLSAPPIAPEDTRKSQESIVRFFRFITRSDLNHPISADETHGKRSYFLCLTFPDLTPVLPYLDTIAAGSDVLELRVDLLHPSGQKPDGEHIPPLQYVGEQIAMLRKNTAVPILFTVRTKSQGGFFPDEAVDEYFTLCHAALRWGCEYLDLEIGKSASETADLLHKKGDTKIVASWHDWSGVSKWDGAQVKQAYDQAFELGDFVKISIKVTDMTDNFAMLQFRSLYAEKKPLITVSMGQDGRLSRILNPLLSPITHPRLPNASAPGQLSFAEIQHALFLLGKLPKQKYCLFGSPIAHSKSPLIHNTAFEMLGLPHNYERHETKDFDDSCISYMRSADFGGASVTIPFKLEAIPHLDELTSEARVIGAINTIIPVRSGDRTVLLGDNTDWRGIREVFLSHITAEHKPYTTESCGLILGAGGTCRAAIYALRSLSMQTIYLFNRTAENAVKVAKSFPADWNIQVITSLDSFPNGEPLVIVSTVPAEGTSSAASPNKDAGVFIPDSVLARPLGGIVIDMAYKPKRTPLIRLAEGKANWITQPGIHVLLAQGFEQFRLWTGRRAPISEVSRVVLESYAETVGQN